MITPTLQAGVAGLLRHVADSIVMPRFQMLAAEDVQEKTPGDPVTIADRESEEALGAGLLALLPEARIIGEEACSLDASVLERAGEGLVWIVDPIDGTANFAAGKPPFALMIALAVNGVTQGSWIYDPLRSRLCHAVRGQGAYIDGQAVQARGTGQAQLVGGISTLFLPGPKRAEVEARAEGRIVMAPIPRCAGEQYPRVALGENDFALFERTLAWDHAAGALWLEEAGGRVARTDGSDYRFADDRTGLIAAASPAIWDQAATILFR